MAQDTYTQTVTIANGASPCSAPVVCNGGHLVGIQMPASWTAANLTFQGSADGVTYQEVYDNNGVEVQVVGTQAAFIPIPPTLLGPLYALNIRSGTAGTPVNQGAARTLQLVFKRYV